MLDFDKLLEEAAPSETTVRLCLNGPLVRRYEEVKERVDARAAQAANELDDARLSGRRKADPEQDELDRLIAEIRDKTATLTLRAMTRDAFVEFVAEKRFEPRKDPKTGDLNPLDQRMQVNTQAFVPALVRASIADPDLSDEQWDRLQAVLSPAQMEKLFGAAWDLNREDREVPFLLGGSPSPPS